MLWLQQVLIECCFIKLTLTYTKDELDVHSSSSQIMEPIPHHCIREKTFFVPVELQLMTKIPSTVNKQTIPLVPFNAEQNKILVYQPFVLLLHKLGFHLPADANKLFVRIPEFWTADMMFTVAEKLGPIPKRKNFKIFSPCDNFIKKFFSRQSQVQH